METAKLREILLLFILLPSFLFSQVIIKERLSIQPASPKSVASTVFQDSLGIKASLPLRMVATSSSGFFPFVLPESMFVSFVVVGWETAAEIDLVLRSPTSEVIIPRANRTMGATWTSPVYPAGTGVVVGIVWRHRGESGTETDVNVIRVNDFTYQLNFEDWTDGDFNDLIVEMLLNRLPPPDDGSEYFLRITNPITHSTFGLTEWLDVVVVDRFGVPVTPPVGTTFSVELVEGEPWGDLFYQDPLGGSTRRGDYLQNLVMDGGVLTLQFVSFGNHLRSEQVGLVLRASTPGIRSTSMRFTLNPSAVVLVLSKTVAEYGETIELTLKRQLPDGRLEDLPEGHYYWFWITHGVGTGILTSEWYSDPEYVDGETPRATFFTQELTPQPEEVDVIIEGGMFDFDTRDDYITNGVLRVVREIFCTRVEFSPERIALGDMTLLTFKKVKPDGTVAEFPDGQRFDVRIISGGGMLSADGGMGTELAGVAAPVRYVAPLEIEGDSIQVQIVANPARTILGAMRIADRSVGRQVPAEVERSLERRRLKRSSRVGLNAPYQAMTFQISDVLCPTGELRVVRGNRLDHFGVRVEPDTVIHGEAATIYVEAMAKDDTEVTLPPGSMVNVVLALDERYGNLVYLERKGKFLDNVPYDDAKAGEVRFVADGENPIGLDPQKVDVGVTGEGKSGVGQVVVKCKLSTMGIDFKQGNPSWGDLDYDRYIERIDTVRSGKKITRIDTVYYKIRRKGCALTTLAMMLKHFGKDETPGTLVAKMTPRFINSRTGEILWDSYVSSLKDFVFGREDGVYPRAVKDSKGRRIKTVSGKDSLDFSKAQPVALSKLDDLLKKCVPVSALVVNPDYNSNHFVTVIRKNGDDYDILDPGASRTKLSEYKNSNGTIYGIRYVNK